MTVHSRTSCRGSRQCACGCGAAVAASALFAHGHNRRVALVRWQCPQCGRVISLKPSRARRRRFCSKRCHDASMRLQVEVDWRSSSAAYLLGVVHGDGNVRPDCVRVTADSKEDGWIDVLKQAFVAVGVAPRIYTHRSRTYVSANSTALAAEFSKFKHYPSLGRSVWALPPRLDLAEWVAGLIDTDGHVSRYRVSLTQRGVRHLRYVRSALQELGIHSRIWEWRPGYPVLRVQGREHLAAFCSTVRLRHPRKVTWLHERVAGRLGVSSYVDGGLCG